MQVVQRQAAGRASKARGGRVRDVDSNRLHQLVQAQPVRLKREIGRVIGRPIDAKRVEPSDAVAVVSVGVNKLQAGDRRVVLGRG